MAGSREGKPWRLVAVASCALVGGAILAGPAAADHREADNQGPRITIDTPDSGAEFVLGSRVRARFHCEDESGVRLCIGSVPNRAPIATSEVGEFSFLVVGIDQEGNSSSLAHRYEVVEKKSDTDPPEDPPNEPPPDESPPPAPQEPPVVPAIAPEVQSEGPVVSPPTNATPGAKLPAPRTRRALAMRPAAGATLAGLQPRLRWRQLAGARFYNVQIFEWRGKRWVKVLSAFPRRASFGPTRSLRAGRRHAWQVWPWRGGGYVRSQVRVSYFDTPAARPSRLKTPRSSTVRSGRDLSLSWRAAPDANAYIVRVSGSGSFTTRTSRTKAMIPAAAVKAGRLRLDVHRLGAKGRSKWLTRRLSVR